MAAAVLLIIDGYNLLHATNILSRSVGPGGLERARTALLNLLVGSLLPEQLSRAVIVFDAREAPYGLPRNVSHHGLSVRYAAKYDDADSLIEEIIEEHSAPKKLTVVSGDHRLHKAARRRKATAIDSEIWLTELLCQRRERHQKSDEASVEQLRQNPLANIAYWLEEFSAEIERSPMEAHRVPTHEKAQDVVNEDDDVENEKPIDDPFPPGYADDLFPREGKE